MKLRPGSQGEPGRRRGAEAEELARLSQQVVSAVGWRMDQLGVTRQQLAQRLGVSPGRVSQILSEDENVTLRTLAAIVAALDGHLDVALRGNEEAPRPAVGLSEEPSDVPPSGPIAVPVVASDWELAGQGRRG